MHKQKQPHSHRRLYVLGLLAGIFVFAVTAYMAVASGFGILERRLFHYVYDLPDGLRPLLLAVTQFGGAWIIIVATIVAYSRGKKQLALRLLLAGLSTYVLVNIAKVLVNRPRPLFFLPELVQRDVFVAGLGFPSGHTAIATALSMTLLPYLQPRYRVLVPIWIIAVGFSRVYLGVHAPLDVIGGFAAGLAIACAIRLVTAKSLTKSPCCRPN